jgi:hypothetical protein
VKVEEGLLGEQQEGERRTREVMGSKYDESILYTCMKI